MVFLHIELRKRVHIAVKARYNFPCTNITAAHVYGVYIFKLTRYSRARGSYKDLRERLDVYKEDLI